MNGVDPYAYQQQVSTRFDLLSQSQQIQTVVDGVEYLFKLILPAFQHLMELISKSDPVIYQNADDR
ncbi:MAG: hypothetical protein JAY90_23230 [Candidatus Thiodiazotropha lotti]|nr:hypothetical protein [Candidatus Thiodiazotropha lotti]